MTTELESPEGTARRNGRNGNGHSKVADAEEVGGQRRRERLCRR